MHKDGPVFYLTGSVRQKVVQAMSTCCASYEVLLPTTFQPSGAQILAAKLQLSSFLTHCTTKTTSSTALSDMMLSVWEVVAYRLNNTNELELHRHFELLVDTLKAINCSELGVAVRKKLLPSNEEHSTVS